uniref:Roadblock/LAMTOR2 domain-containing protein n=1 Tax=Pseudictyota dubia TaxID=2749911 RepID=A0A7R9Z5Z8_9STRA
MIRSRRIPPLLSRITGDGITSALLVTSDGEILGSSSPLSPSAGSSISAEENPNSPAEPPLEMAAVGALVAEVAADYRRLGNELQLLDPRGLQSPPPPPSSVVSSPPPGGSAHASGGKGKSSSSLKCLIIELDLGLVGVASAGSDCHVVALAEPKVEHGMLKARLTVLATHVQEALSHLAEQP